MILRVGPGLCSRPQRRDGMGCAEPDHMRQHRADAARAWVERSQRNNGLSRIRCRQDRRRRSIGAAGSQ
jgi:hypothetical protein